MVVSSLFQGRINMEMQPLRKQVSRKTGLFAKAVITACYCPHTWPLKQLKNSFLLYCSEGVQTSEKGRGHEFMCWVKFKPGLN